MPLPRNERRAKGKRRTRGRDRGRRRGRSSGAGRGGRGGSATWGARGLEVHSAIKTRPRVLGSRAAAEGERTARHFHRLQGARWASVGRPSGPGKGNAAERAVWAVRMRPATVGG